MPATFQEHLAKSTEQAAKALTAAAESLSLEQRLWKPLGKGRSAVDQVAECALINQYSVEILQTLKWPDQTMEEFHKAKDALAESWETAHNALDKSVSELAPAIRAVQDDQMAISITTPFRPMTLDQILIYSYWNMTYHEGQINYIKSLTDED